MPKTDKLTPKQKAFADYYIQSGNAAEAARKAGYSEKTARFSGAENLTKANIQAYISERMQSDEKKRIADADEVMRFYSAVMRGEVKDSFGLDAALADRLKAGDALMKRFIAMQGKAAEDRKALQDNDSGSAGVVILPPIAGGGEDA